MVLETEEHAKARGATIHARLLGAGITSDGFHLVAPIPRVPGAARAMTRAMRDRRTAEVRHHACQRTRDRDPDRGHRRSEGDPQGLAVGNHAAVYAPKSALGHSIGAVGALESVLTVLGIRDGIVPPTLNLENQDPEIDLDVVTGEARHRHIDYAINNSFGFGGHNVALAFGRA